MSQIFLFSLLPIFTWMIWPMSQSLRGSWLSVDDVTGVTGFYSSSVIAFSPPLKSLNDLAFYHSPVLFSHVSFFFSEFILLRLSIGLVLPVVIPLLAPPSLTYSHEHHARLSHVMEAYGFHHMK